jgi:osmotically-inducible protein OsmY
MKWGHVVLLSISLLLSSCVAVVLAGAAAAGMVVYDKRDVAIVQFDTRTAYEINHKIVKDDVFDNSRIGVSTFNRMVLLVGQTPKPSLKNKALKIAQNKKGVKRVYNEIVIANPITISQQTKDAWITSQVKASMLTKKGLKSGSVKIVTENGVVYIMGRVNHDQANLAVDVARRIDGVKKVVKIFQYTD